MIPCVVCHSISGSKSAIVEDSPRLLSNPLSMPALNVPGAALATLTTPVASGASGAALLDLRLAAILTQCKVKIEHMNMIGDAGCDSSQLATT